MDVRMKAAALLGMLAVAPLAAQAETAAGPLKRYAVVIGNSDYVVAPDLKNTGADARLVADFLSDAGYVVFEYHDLGKRGFEAMLRQVLRDVDKDSEVVFYYAGHGLQIAGGNYLVPADADLDDAYDVPFETISLNSIVDILGARARIQMVILDSCRDNPFGNTKLMTDLSGSLSETRDGFSTLTAPVNSLLAFSTSPGTVAYDGDGPNSPYTGSLVEVARAGPDTAVPQLLEQVRKLVFERTEGKQVPWESSTLIEPVAFGGPQEVLRLAEAAPTESLTLSRGLVLIPAAVVVDPTDEPAPQVGEAVTLQARLEPEVAIGTALKDAIGSDEGVTIIDRPSGGHLTLIGDDDRRTGAPGGGLNGQAVDRLIYTSAMVEVPAAQAQQPALTDSFRVAVAGEERVVQLALEADPCDREAGDHLDPDGAGLARFPNEIDPDAALAACRQAVAAYPDEGRFHYQLGRAELALKDFDAARASFEKARELGHTRALYALGLLIANEDAATQGKSGGPIPPEAVALYREGADRGDPYAYHGLGKQLLRYGATPAERQEGFTLLSRALELGHTFAMNELGTYFIDPESPNSDPARGLRYWRESAERGDIYGYDNLGFVYRDGLAGVAEDPGQAAEWFKKAAEGGHPTAPRNLGRLWASGALGESGAYANALKWFDLGLERGDGRSGDYAARLIAEVGIPGMTPIDAAVRAAKTAALGNSEAADSARATLASLPAKAVDGAAQQLVNDLGGGLTVDGAFGPASEAAMEKVLADHGAAVPGGNSIDRAVGLADVYWKSKGFRIDLN